MEILTADIIKDCIRDLYPEYNVVDVYGNQFGDKIRYWYSYEEHGSLSRADYIDMSLVIGWIRDRKIDVIID